MQFMFEFFALFTILIVMSEQLAGITRSVNKFQIINKGVEYKGKLNLLDKWYAAYMYVFEGELQVVKQCIWIPGRCIFLILCSL